MNGVIQLNELTAVPDGEPKHIHGECEVHKKYTVQAFYCNDTLRNPDPPCPLCIIDESAKQGAKEAHEIRKVGVVTLLERSQISPKMRDCKIGGYKPATARAKTYRDICKTFVDDCGSSGNLIMIGNPGTGKTHLGCAVATAIMTQHGKQAIYTRADDLVSYIQDSYDHSTDYSQTKAIGRFGDVPLLVLDELGATDLTSKQRSLLSRVIDKRYLNMLPTISMSNLTLTELKENTDERMMDRLSEGATVMVFDWASHRGQV